MLQALASTTTSVLSTVTSSSSLSSEQIQTLYLLYTSSFLSALDILDREEVVKTEVGEGDLTRLVWTVLGSSDRPYVVLPEADYCSCPAFHANVIVTRQTAMVSEGMNERAKRESEGGTDGVFYLTWSTLPPSSLARYARSVAVQTSLGCQALTRPQPRSDPSTNGHQGLPSSTDRGAGVIEGV